MVADMDSHPPPSRRRLYSCEYDGMSLRVGVLDDAVDWAEVPDVRTMPWATALEWLHAQGYRVRQIEPAHEVPRKVVV